MKTIFLISFTLITCILNAQDSTRLKKVYVEYSTKKPEKNDFTFARCKEYDQFGNLIVYSSTTNEPGKVVKRIEYQYDSFNRIIQVQTFLQNGLSKKRITSLIYEYTHDTIIKCEQPIQDSIMFSCEKNVKKYDSQGNLIRKVLLKNDSLNRFDIYSFEEHRYVYDSLGRILIDSNCIAYPECKITHYIYGENTLSTKRLEHINESNIFHTPQDTVFTMRNYTYHTNDSIATLEVYRYSTLANGRIDMTQYFQNDSLGNIIEFYVIDHLSNSQKKSNHQKYHYAYDEKGQVLSMFHQTFFPKKQRSKIYYRYTYYYWQ